jgi:hypothetical protein
MEIKEKDDGTYTIKGLEVIHLELIAALLAQVRLGMGTEGSNCAFELSELLEENEIDFSYYEVVATKSNGKVVEDFVLEIV